MTGQRWSNFKQTRLWAMQVNLKWTFCILGKWFRLNLRENRLHKSNGTWQFMTNLVVSGQMTRWQMTNQFLPYSWLTYVAQKHLCLSLSFLLLDYSTLLLRSIELSVKTLNVMARARHSAKIKMVNGYPLHLDYTTWCVLSLWSGFYWAFRKHANSEIQKPPSQLRFSLPSIIITITSN